MQYFRVPGLGVSGLGYRLDEETATTQKPALLFIFFGVSPSSRVPAKLKAPSGGDRPLDLGLRFGV